MLYDFSKSNENRWQRLAAPSIRGPSPDRRRKSNLSIIKHVTCRIMTAGPLQSSRPWTVEQRRKKNNIHLRIRVPKRVPALCVRCVCFYVLFFLFIDSFVGLQLGAMVKNVIGSVLDAWKSF